MVSGRPAPVARPPTSGTPGCSSLINPSRLSAGNPKGSARRMASSAPARSGTSSASMPSSGSAVMWNVSSLAPGRHAAHAEIPGPSSSSRSPPMTPCETQPIVCLASSSSRTIAATAAARSRCWGVMNTKTRSTSLAAGRPFSAERSSAASERAASSASSSVESAEAIRGALGRGGLAGSFTPALL